MIVVPKNGVVSRNDHCFIYENRSSPPSFVQNYDFKVGRLDNGFLGNGHIQSREILNYVSSVDGIAESHVAYFLQF